MEVVAVGGISKNGPEYRVSTTVEIYSVSTDTWRRGKKTLSKLMFLSYSVLLNSGVCGINHEPP